MDLDRVWVDAGWQMCKGLGSTSGAEEGVPWSVVSRIHVLLGWGSCTRGPACGRRCPLQAQGFLLTAHAHTHTHTHTHTCTHTQTLGPHHSCSPRDSSSSPAAPPVCAPISPPSCLRVFCPICPLVDWTAVSQTEAERLLLCGGGETGQPRALPPSQAWWEGVASSSVLRPLIHSCVPLGRPAQPRVGPQ